MLKIQHHSFTYWVNLKLFKSLIYRALNFMTVVMTVVPTVDVTDVMIVIVNVVTVCSMAFVITSDDYNEHCHGC